MAPKNENPFALIPGSDDPFGAPARRLNWPRMQELYGRLVLLSPDSVEKVPSRDNKAKLVDRMTATVVVLDGGDLHYGGTPEKKPPVPHTLVGTLPFEIPDMFVSAVAVVNQCRDALLARQTGTGATMVLGRLLTGEQKDSTKSAPYLLEDPTDEDKAIARAYLANKNPFA